MINSTVKTKQGQQKIKAYSVDEIPQAIVNFEPLQRNHKIAYYGTKFLCLDTETSKRDLLTGWIYQWAVKFGSIYIYGRKPTEIIDMFSTLAERYKLNESKRLIVYIHNASYDLQYLKHYLYQYDPMTKFFAIDAHNIIICDILGFRIICSYKLTNLSLAALSANYSEKYIKAVGEIDYNLTRYQDTELNDNDWLYMFSDVAAQYDGILGYLKMQGYKYAHEAPLTSTGFVRTNCRKAAKRDKEWRNMFKRTSLQLEQYNLIRQAFMGGACICSFVYSGVTVRSDKLRHKDFTSSYPARQLLDYFPTGAPSWYGEVESVKELDLLCREYCCCFILTLTNVHIKKGVTAPYIPSSKCIHLENALKLNGKVVKASSLSIVVCELDYKWIKRQYTFDVTQVYVDKMLIFERGKLPEWLRDEVFEYFKNKTTLKKSNPLLYMKSKNMLNGIYGMTATAIIRDKYEMNDNKMLEKHPLNEDERATELNKYYNNYNNFMPYQAAVWTTAHARDALFSMIEATGDNDGIESDLSNTYKNFLYCDTDSVFYIETPENKPRMEEYTKECQQRAIEAGAEYQGNFLGAPTDEPALRAFRGLHSKCYAMEEMNDNGEYELNVVIAGIPKKAIRWINGEPVTMTNAEELKSIDNLEDGFIFRHCGGVRCVYNERVPEAVDINGHMTELSSSAIIENIEKEISNTMYTNGANYDCLNIVQNS